MKQLFTSASLTLTGWYLLIVMAISLSFSAIIYQISVAEITRGLTPATGVLRQLVIDQERFEIFRAQRIEEGRAHVLLNLFILNITSLTLGGVASYFLARRTLEPIQTAMDEQTRFASDASHELRTPLTAMRSEIEIALRNKKLSAKEGRAFLESNLEEVEKLQSLSDRLLLLANETTLPLGPVQLQAAVAEAIARNSAAAEKKMIEIKNATRPVLVRAHQESLTDLYSIFLENAIKYSGEHTTIIISAEQQKNDVMVQVRDQGRGIAEKDLPHIFERFYRADSSRSNADESGHGLGLSIAQRIARQHHTVVKVESTVGAGTAFSFTLPIV